MMKHYELDLDDGQYEFDGYSYCAIDSRSNTVTESPPNDNLTRGEAIELFRFLGLNIES